MQMINEVTTRDELADLVGIPYRKLTYILILKICRKYVHII